MAKDQQNSPNGLQQGSPVTDKMPDELQQFVAVVQGCLSRMHTYRNAGSNGTDPTFSDPLPVVINPHPGVRQCNWDEFKNRRPDTVLFSIETLVAGPNLHLSVYDESVKRGLRGPPEECYEQLSCCMDTGVASPRIHRIRIQSAAILRLLNTVSGDSWDITRSHTFFRPFAYLIHHQVKVKQMFDVLSTLAPTLASLHVSDSQRTATGDRLAEEASPGISARAVLEDIRAYIDFVDTALLPLYQQFEGLSNGSLTVDFDDLWYLFRPGELVWCSWEAMPDNEDEESLDLPGRQEMWRMINFKPYVHSVRYDLLYNEIDVKRPTKNIPGQAIAVCYYLDNDGEKLIPVWRDFPITPFSGRRKIKDLCVFPVRFLPEFDQRVLEFKKRGERFLRSIQLGHVWYKGQTLLIDPKGKRDRNGNGKLAEATDDYEGDVIVDFRGAIADNFRWRLKHHPEEDQSVGSSTTVELYRVVCWNENTKSPRIVAESHYELVVGNDDIERFERSTFRAEDRFVATADRDLGKVQLTDKDLVLLPLRVYGFRLGVRSYDLLNVNGITEINYNPSALDELEIGNFHKKMIQSLVDSHFKDKALANAHPELENYRGSKAQGLVILIQGPPGVGKTATAQATAQVTQRPLLSIGLEDVDVMGEKFRWLFGRAEAWGAVILLDEVDVYLSHRSAHDMNANIMVTVFLHVLENFSGIIFLTTNRPGVLDEAVKSRAHAIICYQPLNLERTIRVFQLNIKKLIRDEEIRNSLTEGNELVVMEDQVIEFARDHYLSHCKEKELTPWNGRQIANAFRIATSLARYEVLCNPKAQPQLRRSHFDQVELLTREYDRARFYAIGKSDSKFAYDQGERYDEVEDGNDNWQDQHQTDISTLPGRLDTLSSPNYNDYRMRLVPSIPVTTPLGRGGSENKTKNFGASADRTRLPQSSYHHGSAVVQHQETNFGD
ncbi:hypothetical protein QBC47DRAFT_371081 [Echria macrotheca]|uniref:AAA+ ATPase domain-containing protein n=1 Tax=Echria macrotheca TaxID=438768 RepID=A0AAJ0BIW3_9PEZI|nr:hypothetical protein QBC47DRAFT_371081 [Echria macrotheca]